MPHPAYGLHLHPELLFCLTPIKREPNISLKSAEVKFQLHLELYVHCLRDDMTSCRAVQSLWAQFLKAKVCQHHRLGDIHNHNNQKRTLDPNESWKNRCKTHKCKIHKRTWWISSGGHRYVKKCFTGRPTKNSETRFAMRLCIVVNCRHPWLKTPILAKLRKFGESTL